MRPQINAEIKDEPNFEHSSLTQAISNVLTRSCDFKGGPVFSSLKAWFPLDRNRIVKSRGSSGFWLIVERLITIKGKGLAEVALDLRPERFFVIDSYKPSCGELRHAWVARFRGPIAVQWGPGLSNHLMCS